MLETLGRHWWTIALRGLLAIILGIVAFVWPGITVAALVLLFGVYAIIDGVVALVASVRLMEGHGRWWPALFEGICGITAGIVAFAWPGVTAVALVYLIAVWAIVTGVLEIVAALQLRRHVAGEWMLALGGVLSVLLGVFLFAFPVAGLVAWAWMVGAYALLFGIVMLTLGFRLRALGGDNLRLTAQH